MTLQQLGPTCGFYAMANGWRYIHQDESNRAGVDERIGAWLKTYQEQEKTLVGELFGDDVCEALLREVLGATHVIDKVSIDTLFDPKRHRAFEMKKQFALLSVASTWNPAHTVSHWLVLVREPSGGWYVLDSNDGKKKRTWPFWMKRRHYRQRDTTFDWRKYERSPKRPRSEAHRTIERAVRNGVAQLPEHLTDHSPLVFHEVGDAFLVQKMVHY